MADKRKHRRANLIYYLEIHDQETNKCLGHLVDISLGGLKMISELKTVPGNEHNIRIFLPKGASEKSIAMKAKACWSATDINPDYHASGLEFIELSEESTQVIQQLINRYELGKGTVQAAY
jgi:c-di-GMP-binding flagellar brake protein YcgR